MRLQMYVYILLYGVCVCVFVFVVVAAAASFSSCEQSMRFLRISSGVYVTNERLS